MRKIRLTIVGEIEVRPENYSENDDIIDVEEANFNQDPAEYLDGMMTLGKLATHFELIDE